MTLAEFLLARYEESAAQTDALMLEGSAPIKELERAKVALDGLRKIVAAAEDWRWDRDDAPPDPKSDTVLELLALPYADHPDYREEWKP